MVRVHPDRAGGEEPVHPSSSIVGIDLGVVRFATLSNREVIQPCNPLHKKQARLQRYQRRMARRVKFTENWKKAKAKGNPVHRKIAHIRSDFLHQTTTAISQNHALVVIEDLQVQNLSKSAAGTKENPGSNVKQQSGLNRSIRDQAWREWRRQLEYKQDWRGGRLVALAPHGTSQECPLCGHIAPCNRRTQALFVCQSCGYTANADYVSSMNILSRGIKVLRDEGQDTAQACAGWETTARKPGCEVNGAVRPSAAGTRRRETPCVIPWESPAFRRERMSMCDVLTITVKSASSAGTVTVRLTLTVSQSESWANAVAANSNIRAAYLISGL